MTTPDTRGDREKVVSKLPSWLRQELKVRAVQHGIDMQDAVEAGITAWRGLGSNLSPIDTSGAESFATFLPSPLWTGFRSDCKRRGVSLIQGLAQSVRVWLDSHPAPAVKRPDIVRRVVICNQKGGVGKTAVTAGTGEALAEDSTALVPVRVSKHFAALLEEDEEAAA